MFITFKQQRNRWHPAQEEQEEEEASETNQLKAKLEDTGFFKSFILSLILN